MAEEQFTQSGSAIPEQRFFRSPLVPIFLIVMVDVLGFTLMIPLLPFYAEHFHATPMLVGILLSSYAVFQFVSGPILGRISDKVGRKPTLLVSQAGSFAGFIILGLAGSMWMLFLGRIIDGITAGNLSIAQAYISDVTKPEERTKAFGIIGIAFGVGFLFGPALSGFLSEYGYYLPAFVAAGLSLTSILFTWLFLPDIRPKPVDPNAIRPGRIRQITQYLERPAPRRSLIEFWMFILAFSTLIGGLALFLERQLHFGVREVGLVYAFSGLVGAIIQGGLLGRLVKWLGEKKLSVFGFGTMALGYSLLGLAHSWVFLLVLVTLGGFGAAVVRPSLTTLVTKSVGAHEQGAALGVSQSLASIAQIIGPLIAAFFIQNELLGMYGITAGAIAFLGALLLLRRSAAVDSSVSL